MSLTGEAHDIPSLSVYSVGGTLVLILASLPISTHPKGSQGGSS